MYVDFIWWVREWWSINEREKNKNKKTNKKQKTSWHVWNGQMKHSLHEYFRKEKTFVTIIQMHLVIHCFKLIQMCSPIRLSVELHNGCSHLDVQILSDKKQIKMCRFTNREAPIYISIAIGHASTECRVSSGRGLVHHCIHW